MYVGLSRPIGLGLVLRGLMMVQNYSPDVFQCTRHLLPIMVDWFRVVMIVEEHLLSNLKAQEAVRQTAPVFHQDHELQLCLFSKMDSYLSFAKWRGKGPALIPRVLKANDSLWSLVSQKILSFLL